MAEMKGEFSDERRQKKQGKMVKKKKEENSKKKGRAEDVMRHLMFLTPLLSRSLLLLT